MREFLDINRHKLAFAFMACSLVFLAIWLAVYAIAYINGHKADLDSILPVLLYFGLALPCFIIFVTFLAWYYKQWAKKKAFSKLPFDKLQEIGFSDALLNEKSKWLFTEMVKEGTIDGFVFVMDILYDKRHIIEFRVFPAWRPMEKKDYKRVSNEFKAYDLEFEGESIVKRFNTINLLVSTISDLKNDLQEFTSVLKGNGFEPPITHERTPNRLG